MTKHSAQWWANALDTTVEKIDLTDGVCVVIDGNPCWEVTGLVSDVDTMEKVVRSQMIGGKNA